MQLDRDQARGDYRTIEPGGAGGMGEVYRARDGRLDRDVAIKVLPGSVARDPHALARFEREAKAIAALSHPNILAVHDFGHVEDTWYVVTELLEGETLRARLEQGTLAPRKAAELGRQIAQGLAAAHDKGIVHRDLKPENLFVTGDGRIKILDFGLAADAATPLGETRDGTTRTQLTAPGTVLGTVAYMSPEQVRGESVDPRSDIFSFGAVLYEMVGGSRPFRRDTAAETMTAILKEEPPELLSVSGEIPPALATIVRRCMEKRPGERFQSAHDLAFSLEALSSSTRTSGATHAVAGVPERRPRRTAVWMLGLLIAGAALGAVAMALLSRPRPYEPPAIKPLSARRGIVTDGRFLPGGGSAVYSATWEGAPLDVFVVDTESGAARSLGLEGAAVLAVSASGEMALALDRRFTIGFEAIGTLAVTTAQGSAPRRLLENVLAADWAPDGKSLAVAHEVGGVVRLEYPIGTVLYDAPGWIGALRVHPDGERIAFSDRPVRGDNTGLLKIVDRHGKVTDLGPGGAWGLAWGPDGTEVVHSNSLVLIAVKPDGRRRRFYSSSTGLGLLDIAKSGDVLMGCADTQREMFGRAPGAGTERNLSWLDWTTPRVLSPDGRTVLFEEGNQVSPDGYAIYLRGTDGSAPVPLGAGTVVAVSPDGRWVVSIVGVFGDSPRVVLVPTGPGTSRDLNSLGTMRIRPRGTAWIPGPGPDPDQAAIVFAASLPDAPTRLYRMSLGPDSAPRPITPEDFPLAPQSVVLSPDGRSVVVLPVAGAAMRFPVEGGAAAPVPGLAPGEIPLRFDRDGRHLYVQVAARLPSRIARVDVLTGAREPWLELAPNDPAGVLTADYVQVSDDGSAYVYSSRRTLSRLALFRGLF